jgi:hypothetical protein
MNLPCDLQLNTQPFEILKTLTELVVFREVLVDEVLLLLLETYV